MATIIQHLLHAGTALNALYVLSPTLQMKAVAQ